MSHRLALPDGVPFGCYASVTGGSRRFPPLPDLTMNHLARAAQLIIQAIAFTYCVGYEVGAWVHKSSTQLGAAHVTALGLATPAVPAMEVVAVAAADLTPLVVTVNQMTAIAADLERLTIRELQAITGIRRRVSKAQLIGAYLQMA